MFEFDRINVSYVAVLLKIGVKECLTNAKAIKCLMAMKKYGTERWWNYKDVEEIAYYQINEPVLLVSYNKFQSGIEKLLGRPVKDHEMEFGQVKLKREVEKAFAERFLGMKREEN